MRFYTTRYLKEKTKLSKLTKRVSGCFVFFVIIVFILSPVNFAKAENNQGDQETKQQLKKIDEIEVIKSNFIQKTLDGYKIKIPLICMAGS